VLEDERLETGTALLSRTARFPFPTSDLCSILPDSGAQLFLREAGEQSHRGYGD
jgi:hypothetical protein